MKLNLTHCSLAFIFGAGVSFVFPFIPVTVSVFVCIVTIAYKRFFVGSIIPLIITGTLGFVYCYPIEYVDTEKLLNRKIVITFHIESSSLNSNFYRNVKVYEIYDYESRGNIKSNKVNVLSKQPLEKLKIYRAIGTVSKDSFHLNPFMYQDALTISLTEVNMTSDYTMSYVDNLRQKVNDYLDSNFSPNSAIFLKAIVTGSREDMSQEIRDSFARTGLAHILSISGAHFGLFIFVVFKFLNIMIRLLPERLLVNMTIHIGPSQITAILTAPLVLFYLLLSSMSYPAIRSFIMICFFLIALLIERRRYMAQSLTFAGLIIIALFPDSPTNLSFQLSFLSVLSIFIGMSITDNLTTQKDGLYDRNIKDKILDALKNSIVITLSATIGTAPLTAYYFHYFSIISPITNLVITPFIGFVILPIAILSSMLYILTDWFMMSALLNQITDMMIQTVHYLSLIEYADVKVASFPTAIIIMSTLSILLSGVMVSIKFHEKSRKAQLTVFLLFIIPLLSIIAFKHFYKDKDLLKITYLDVGQGDSAVVELPDHKVIVIDTGKNSFITSKFLRYRGIKVVDALVVSHPQSDHIGGIERLVKEFIIKEIWDNGYVSYNEKLISGMYHRRLQRGDKTGGIGYSILTIHPHSEFKPDKNVENNLSLVIKIETTKNSFLFTGDIELEAINDITQLKDRLKSTVIKIPHHGSRTSLSRGFLELVSPNIAIISVGRMNVYKFPHKEIFALLEGVKVYRTDEIGAIRIKESRGGSLSILTARDFKITRVDNIYDEWFNLKRLFMVWY